MTLSNRKIKYATYIGQRTAARFVLDSIEHPELFPEGQQSIPKLAGRIALVSLSGCVKWSSTDEEEILARDVAVTEANRLFALSEYECKAQCETILDTKTF